MGILFVFFSIWLGWFSGVHRISIILLYTRNIYSSKMQPRQREEKRLLVHAGPASWQMVLALLPEPLWNQLFLPEWTSQLGAGEGADLPPDHSCLRSFSLCFLRWAPLWQSPDLASCPTELFSQFLSSSFHSDVPKHVRAHRCWRWNQSSGCKCHFASSNSLALSSVPPSSWILRNWSQEEAGWKWLAPSSLQLGKLRLRAIE